MTLNRPDRSKVPRDAIEVLDRLWSEGHEAYLVGGGVRDMFLGRSVDDWDLATSASPETVMSCFERVVPTGLEHGTVTVVINQAAFEVTTYRVDGDYSDGRRPDSITFTSNLNEDLARRDFTINAMAWNPLEGSVHDPFGGQDDLRQGIIRAVGVARQRLAEDGLRAMRAIRFSASLGFAIEPSLRIAIGDTLEIFSQVSVERIAVEFRKTLASANPVDGLCALKDTGLLLGVLPELERLSESQWHTVLNRISRSTNDFMIRLALCLSLNGADAHQAARRLRYSKRIIGSVERLLQNADVATLDTTDSVEVFSLAQRVGRAELDRFCDFLRAERKTVPLAEALALRWEPIQAGRLPLVAKDLPITGADVMQRLKMKPSKRVGEILDRLLKAVWEAPDLNNAEALMNMLARFDNGDLT